MLLASEPRAVRIDETNARVHALNRSGEAVIELHPNGDSGRYLRLVREFLSTGVLGFPAGYPVFLRRWTRMGQTNDHSIERLLLLGEPEAVVAVVNAPGLTVEQARLAWWAMPTVANARELLAHESIAASDLGPVLATTLLDHLPFETEPLTVLETARLLARPGLLPDDDRVELWRRSRRHSAVVIGFMRADAGEVPGDRPARAALATHVALLRELAGADNPVAAMLAQVLDAPGQRYVCAAREALKTLPDQDIVNAWIETIAGYFGPVRPSAMACGELDELHSRLALALSDSTVLAEAAAVRAAAPALAREIHAVLTLSLLDYGVVRPVLSRTSAVGALMRRKLADTLAGLDDELAVLAGEAPDEGRAAGRRRPGRGKGRGDRFP